MKRSWDPPAEPAKKSKGSASKAKTIPEGILELGSDCFVKYLPKWLGNRDREIFACLKNELAWEEKEVMIMGRPILQPRKVAYYADDNSLVYTYSGQTMIPLIWTKTLQQVRNELQDHLGTKFNACLANYYRHGNDSMSWHSDNERLYGPRPVIASVSFGDCRDFCMRKNSDNTEKYQVPLGSGDLLVMEGDTQEQWMHCVPKRKAAGARINLTFRYVKFPHLDKGHKQGGAA